MAKNQTLQHKRSTDAGKIPTPDKIAVGELALNLADYSIYTKTPSGDIIELARDVIKSSTQPTSPAPVNGDLWYDTVNDILNVFNGVSWVPSNFSGLPVLPANTSATPTWSSGAGTSSSPYLFNVTVTPGATLLVSSMVVTGLSPGQLVPITDLNSATNGGRFSFTNNLADGSGTLRFNVIFTDLPASAAGATLSASIRIGTATVYLAITASMASSFPQSGVSFPVELGSATTQWTAPADSLTSTGDIEISTNGTTYSQGPLAITGGTLYTRWKGAAGSGIGIDGASGTTITGSVVAASNGTDVFSSLVIDKNPDPILFNPQTGVAQSSATASNVVTIDGVNSYLYLTSADVVYASINGGAFTLVPSSGTSLFIEDAQTLALRQTSSSSSNTATTVTVSAGEGTTTFTVTTISAGIVTPSITAPINGSSGISVVATITASAYSVVGSVGTHLNSDWEISSDSGFGTIVTSSMASTTNLTSWAPTGLNFTTQYWVRVRYRSSGGSVSSYSSAVTWTTGLNTGINWTNQTQLSSTTWGSTDTVYGIVWNGTQYLAVGTNGKAATSPNGITWTYQPGLRTAVTRDTPMNCVVWSGTQYVAGGGSNDGPNNPDIVTSPDGVTWTSQTGLVSAWGNGDYVNALLWTGTQYLVVGDGGKVASSPTGVVWTNIAGLRSTSWGSTDVRSVVWNGTQYLVVGDGGRVATSPTGTVWTYQAGLSSTTWGTAVAYSVVWNGTQYLVVGASGRVATSPDGAVWTYQAGLSSTTWGTTTAAYSVVWNGTQYLVVGASGKVATSPDGITWTYRAGLSSTTWGTSTTVRAAEWNGTQYLVGGASGKVATSP